MIIRSMMAAGRAGILGEFPGSNAAYSTRALTPNLHAPIMRVRRDSDNSQQDFGANDDGDLDTAAILAFVGAGGIGGIATWYDQSGSGNHVTNAVNINQPLIVNNGFLIQTNGKPSVDFIPGFPTYLKNTAFSMNTNPHTVFSVVDYAFNDVNLRRFLSLQRNTGSQGNWIYASSSGTILAGSRHPVNNQIDSLPVPTTQDTLYYMTNSPNYQEMSVGGGFRFNDSGTITHADMQQIRVGQGDSDTGDTVWRGKIQEIILYPADRSADRVDIEQNQNDYWGII